MCHDWAVKLLWLSGYSMGSFKTSFVYNKSQSCIPYVDLRSLWVAHPDLKSSTATCPAEQDQEISQVFFKVLFNADAADEDDAYRDRNRWSAWSRALHMSLQATKTWTESSNNSGRKPGIGNKAHSPKFLPTIQCHVGLYFLSNSFLMNAAMSFSTLYFSNACSESSQVISWLTLMWLPGIARQTYQYRTTTFGATKSCTAVTFWARAFQRDFTKSDTCVAQSMASCCISSDMSAFLITDFLSDMMPVPSVEGATRQTGVWCGEGELSPLASQSFVRNFMPHYTSVRIR